MILSDVDLRAAIADRRLVERLEFDAVQPCSVDVRLGGRLAFIDERVEIDPGANQWGRTEELDIPADGWPLTPGRFVLGFTRELVSVPDDLACMVEGRSSLGRCGLQVHSTAGFVDPGFHGSVTMELSNVGPAPIRLRAGMPIGQLVFVRLTSPALSPHGADGRASRCRDQSGSVGARPVG